MTLTAFALIVLAGLIHAGWNIVAKKAGGDARFAFFTAFLMMLLWAPLGWWLGRDVVPGWGAIEWALGAGQRRVARASISWSCCAATARPISRWCTPWRGASGPLLSSLVAIVFLGEQHLRAGRGGHCGRGGRRVPDRRRAWPAARGARPGGAGAGAQGHGLWPAHRRVHCRPTRWSMVMRSSGC